MSWEGEGLIRGFDSMATKEGGDYDLKYVDTFKFASPQFASKVALDPSVGAAGQMAAWANPHEADILIIDIRLDITTKSTSAATADAGVAANATTLNDTMIDGVDIGAAAIDASSQNNRGTNGGSLRKMTKTQFLTVTAVADPVGLVGNLLVLWVPIP